MSKRLLILDQGDLDSSIFISISLFVIVIVIYKILYGSIYDWGTTFKTKDLRTMSHWISVFIRIYYYLINKF